MDASPVTVVAGIDVNHANLQGTLVKELFLLIDMSLLHLDSNRFSGTVLDTFKDLSSPNWRRWWWAAAIKQLTEHETQPGRSKCRREISYLILLIFIFKIILIVFKNSLIGFYIIFTKFYLKWFFWYYIGIIFIDLKTSGSYKEELKPWIFFPFSVNFWRISLVVML